MKWRQCCKQAERWLEDECERARLAITISKIALKGKSLGVRLTRQEKENTKDRFLENLYECLCWLHNTFKTGVPKEVTNLKEDLTEHLELYVNALHVLKDKAEKSKDLKGNREVVNVIHGCIDLLIKKITS